MNKEQILYEDKDIIVCYKPAGIATQTSKVGERDMVSEVANYLDSGGRNGKPYVGVIHRLDQPVEGILVFAKNQRAAAGLSRQITENEMEKYYYAVVCDEHESKKENDKDKVILVDYLYKDGKTNTTSIVSKEHMDSKRAELIYRIKDRIRIDLCSETEVGERKYSVNMTNMSEKEKGLLNFSNIADKDLLLAKIKLITGRHHQIRVQMSHAGMSLLGDFKYANEQVKKLSKQLQIKQIALCACELCFGHPITGKRLQFQIKPKGAIFQKFSL